MLETVGNNFKDNTPTLILDGNKVEYMTNTEIERDVNVFNINKNNSTQFNSNKINNKEILNFDKNNLTTEIEENEGNFKLILDNRIINKKQRITFNELPPLKYKHKRDSSYNKNDKEINNKNKNENFTLLELNYKQMSKELEDLKRENNMIKYKLDSLVPKKKNVIPTSNSCSDLIKKIGGINNLYIYKSKQKNIKYINKANNIQLTKIPASENKCNKKSKKIQESKKNFLKNNKTNNNLNNSTCIEENLSHFRTISNNHNFLNFTYLQNKSTKNFQNRRGIRDYLEKKNGGAVESQIIKKSETFEKNVPINKKNIIFNVKRIKTNHSTSMMVNKLSKKIKRNKRLNIDLIEQNKKTENKINLIVKDSNKINGKLISFNKTKDEYKTKKEPEIQKYVYDLESNQRTIKELNSEKEKLLKSKKEIELLNEKLEKIITEKRKKYQDAQRAASVKSNNNNNNENMSYSHNKDSILKLKYDILVKENTEMKNEIINLQKKLTDIQDIKESENQTNSILLESQRNKNSIRKISSSSQSKHENNNNNANNYINNKNGMNRTNLQQYSQEDIRNILNSLNKDMKSLNRHHSNKSNNNSNNTNNTNINITICNNSKDSSKRNSKKNSKRNLANKQNCKRKVEMIDINNEEIRLYNRQINLLTENKKNQVEKTQLENELKLKNEEIVLLNNKLKELETEKSKIFENNEKILEDYENCKKLLTEEKTKTEKLKIFAEEQQSKHMKYKTKLEEYKKKYANLNEEFNKSKNNLLNSGEITEKYKRTNSLIIGSDGKNSTRLREDNILLKEKLEEERQKSEVLQLITANVKEKIENLKNKYHSAKKLNTSLINKLKERDVNVSKQFEKENIKLKNELDIKIKSIEELNNKIKKLYNDIDNYKKENKKMYDREKVNNEEKDKLREIINTKDNEIKETNTKIKDLNNKYEESVNKNIKLEKDINELNAKYNDILNSKNNSPKTKERNNKLNIKEENNNSSKKLYKNKTLDSEKEHENNIQNNINSQSDIILKKNFDSDITNSTSTGIKKYNLQKNSNEIIKELNEDLMSISDSDSINKNIIRNNKKNEKEKNDSKNSSFISEDDQEMDPIVESILSKKDVNSEIIFGNNHSKSIGDKSTKNEG